MDKRLGTLIDSYRDEFVAKLQEWIRVPSVKGDPAEGAPFGPEIGRMMKLAMKTAEEMGFSVRAFDGYACDATLGDREDVLGVLGHLDVVPVGDGWERDPFGAEIADGRLVGRGTADDKGPAVAALFAMKAILDAGIPLSRKCRLILGCDEECGMEDLTYYEKKIGLPALGFSPDVNFQLINTE